MEQAPLFIGCCGWAEAQGLYVRHFRTIELQTTFYEPPSITVAKRWRTEAPPEFRFCMKAWQLITHTPASPTYRRLKSVLSPTERDLYGSFRPTEQVWLAWQRTKEIAEILRTEVILFQCPRSFLPTGENIGNLTAFFREIDRGQYTLAWEPRGDDWSPALIRDLCAENNLVHCVDPFESIPAYGEVLYWRLHGRSGYRYRYTEEDLIILEAKLKPHAHVPGPNYVFFNNIYSKDDAMRFCAKVQAARSAGATVSARQARED
jgi:uncharacterized protein YecE (DUF72 family)